VPANDPDPPPRERGGDPLAALRRLGEHRLPLVAQRRLRNPGAAPVAQAAIRALAMAVPMRGEAQQPVLLCRVLGRYKMLVSASDLSHAPHLALDGYWKWWVTAFLARNLAPGQRFVDAGAGYGYFALLAGDLVGPAGSVLAIEANPGLVALLRRNLGLNGMADRSVVEAGAIGPDGGQARLVVPHDSPVAARLLPPGTLESAIAGAQVVEVPVARPLDALLPAGADWIRLDLNGAEPAAWPGLQPVLDRSPGIGLIVSLDPSRLDDATGWLGRLAERFPLRRIDEDGHARPIRREDVPDRGETTLFLSRRDPR
jgi:FkbM family methyltransferase